MTLVYFWKAFYDDGTEFWQFDRLTGQENLFAEIDQSRLVKFGWFSFSKEFAELCRYQGHDVVAKPLPSYVVHLRRNQRLIAVRRIFIHYMTSPVRIVGQKIVYLLGWQETIRGRNHKCIMFIFDDGHVELSDNMFQVGLSPNDSRVRRFQV